MKTLIQDFVKINKYILVIYCCVQAMIGNAQSIASVPIANNCYAINGMYIGDLYARKEILPRTSPRKYYIDYTKRILGNANLEDKVLTFARNNGINYLLCYEVGLIISDPVSAAQFAAFIKKGREQFGIQQIGADLSEENSTVDMIVQYNQAHSTVERIDVLSLEYEFWSPNFPDSDVELDYAIEQLNYFTLKGHPANLETEIYIGNFKDQAQATRLANAVDRVLVHFYRKNDIDIINYNTYRLEMLGNGRVGSKLKIAPIFSSEGTGYTADIPFMGDWLETHPQEQAFKTWMNGYNGLTGSWKNNLEVIGATWFVYSTFLDNPVTPYLTTHITSHPVNQEACIGQTKTFTVASSAINKVYYWTKNGQCLQDGDHISGSQTATLTISNITDNEAGIYYCRVVSYDASNPGTFASNNATLTVGSGACNKAPSVNIDFPATNATFTALATVNISASATDLDGTISKVEFYNGNTLLGSDNLAPFNFVWTNVGEGSYTIYAKATDNYGASTTSAGVQLIVNVPQSPYNGTAWPIPGIIQAEHYDLGGQGIAYYDLSPTNEGDNNFRNDAVDIENCSDVSDKIDVGYIMAGEWLAYTVNIQQTTNYDIEIRTASTGTNKKLHIEIDGSNISGTVNLPNTAGWDTWQTTKITNKALSAGTKVMKVVMETGDFNLNYVEFKKSIITGTDANTYSSTALLFYPNPCQGYLQLTHHLGHEYDIYNTLGEKIIHGIVDETESVNIANLHHGTYLIRLTNGIEVITHKFIKF